MKKSTAIVAMGISATVTAAALYKFKETKSPAVEILLPLVIVIGIVGISMSCVDYKSAIKEKEEK